MSSTVEQIKDRLSIQDVVGSYVKLERAGKNMRARCPFHNEKTPSFFVSPERNAYHCFGCNRGGDIFSFVQEFEGLDFLGALRVLADRAGVEITPIDPRAASERERLFGLLESASRFFTEKLEKNKNAGDYLKKRGLSEEIISAFRLGYAPSAWRDLREYFNDKGYTDDELLKVGLIKKPEKSGDQGSTVSEGKYYDTFRDRVMFPIFDGAGRVIAFSGRLLSADKTENAPKYLNSPETAFFSKSGVLYGLERAKQAIRKYNFAIVVEGQLDVLLAHMAGYSNTAAPLGTALTGTHLDRVHQLTENVVFAFDADSAGLASFQRAATLALDRGFDVKVAMLPDGKDPADVISEDPKQWKKIIKSALHTVDFLLAVLREKFVDLPAPDRMGRQAGERAFKKEVTKTVLPYIARISNKIDQAHFVKQVSEVLGVSEIAVYAELEKVPATESTFSEEKPSVQISTPHSRRDMALERILGILEWQEKTSEPLIDVDSARKRVSSLISQQDLAGYMKIIKESGEKAFEAEVALTDVVSLDNYLEELFLVLEGELLQEELTASLSELREAEKSDNSTLVESLLKHCQELAQKIEQHKQTLQQMQ